MACTKVHRILWRRAVGVEIFGIPFFKPHSTHGTLNKETIVVSTSSITLQNQLEQKDLPFVQMVIQNHFGERINFVSLKVISNFCCLREFERYSNILKADYPEIYELYADGTGTGEQPDEIDYELWQKITTNHSDCDGQTCKYIDQCYIEEKNEPECERNHHQSRSSGYDCLPFEKIRSVILPHTIFSSLTSATGGAIRLNFWACFPPLPLKGWKPNSPLFLKKLPRCAL